jgi:hypothetical protein
VLVRRFALYCIFSFVVLATPDFAQQLSSSVTGTVASDDGTPLPNVSVRWAQLGKTVSVLTDASGKFSFEFAEAGVRTLRFEHASTSTAGTYAAMLHENISIDLAVVLHHEDGSGNGDTWSIKQQYGKSPAIAFPERVISSESMNAQPTTESLWSFLNMTEPSVVADRFDISGLHSYRQLLLGVRGSSWTQNQGMVNGLSISNPTGDGLLAFPDLSTMESIVYSVGTSPTRHTGPGAHIQLIPKTGGRERHGQARISFQSGALQNTNVIARYRDFGLTESDERWKHFVNGGVQLGGPLGKSRWTYFTALSVRDAEKWVRNQDLPISGSVAQETFNTVGEWSPNDRFSFYGAMQQRREPQAEASPLVTRDSSVRQNQTYRQGQGVWTHLMSSREFLQVRGGASVTHLNSKFQTGVTGQSQEDIFPGYVVDGIFPRLLRMGELYEMMVNTRRGPAPLVTSYDSGVWEGAVSYSSERHALGIRHQLSSGANFTLASLKERDEAIDGVNLGFFYQAPYTVRLLSTPVKTHDRIRQLELYTSDRFSLSRLSVIAGLSADVSEGVSILTTGRSTNDILWSNVGGNFGAAFQVARRRPLIVRAAVARIFDQPTLNVWNGSNPQGLGTRTYLWDDVNGDRQFQPGENTQLLKVSGAPYTRVDPSLKNPMTSEITMGLTQSGLWRFTVEASGFRRTTQNLMSLVNEGVPFSAYTPVQAMDWGQDAIAFTADDRPFTVYNQKFDTLGKDRYLLTNPRGFSSHSEGFELRLRFASQRAQWEATVTRYRSVAATAPGATADQNDTSAFAGVFDDPNKTIFARGSTFFDRGTLGRFRATLEMPWKLRASLIGSYQDGLPYSRLIVVEGLNQGVIGVRTAQRGPGEAGSRVGSMTQHYETLDMRLSRSFGLKKGRLTATLDAFNLRNLALATVEGDVTSATEKWRFPIRFQTPRSLQLGLRFDW